MDANDKILRAIQGRRKRPFSWGQHDCCKAANALLWAGYRVSLMVGLPRYNSLRGALKAIKKDGHTTLEGMIAARALKAGFKEIAPAHAQRGDLVLLPWPQGEDTALKVAPGVVVGATAVYASDTGWQHVPTSLAVRAFTLCQE